MDMKTKRGLFESLLLARIFEEKKIQLAREIAKTDIGPTSCYGQEAIPVGFCYGLNREDYILPSIRSAWPAYLTKGLPLRPIAAEMFSKAGGFSHGREASSHITYLELGIIGGTGVLASTATVATGIALSHRYRKTRGIAICFLGDGASNREDFFTGLNFAALRSLPVIYVVENNQIAELTPIRKFMPIKNIADRALAFGIPGVIVDGNDVIAVYETAVQAIARARDGLGPTLVECKTCRVRSMSEMQEPGRGLPKEIIDEWKEKDPVKRIQEHLLAIDALTAIQVAELRSKYQSEVDEAFEFAMNSPYASREEVFRDVYEGGLLK